LAKEIKRRTKAVAFCKEDTVEKLLYLLGEAWGAQAPRVCGNPDRKLPCWPDKINATLYQNKPR
jgi:hypothetical protein